MHKNMLSVFGGVALLIGSHCAAVQAQDISVTLVSTFDSPPGSILDTGKINDSGTFAASLIRNHLFTVFGCRVYAGGNFSAPFSEPNDNVGYTTAEGINAGGEVCGRYDDMFQTHGYFRRGSTFKTYDVPIRGVSATAVEDLNDAHNFVGSYIVATSTAFAYANIDGNLITIPIPGILPEATGINNLNDVVGVYGDNGGGTFHGFMRASDGTLIFPIDFPGAGHTTAPEAINDEGFIVGWWTHDITSHAFVIRLPDTVLSYDVPGATFTSFTGINNSGLIVGTYADQQHLTHGLLAQLNQ